MSKLTPLLLRFAEPIPPMAEPSYRYREDLQIGEYLIDGTWRPAHQVREPSLERTRNTMVVRETTDDE
jgi:hypothetical protein